MKKNENLESRSRSRSDDNVNEITAAIMRYEESVNDILRLFTDKMGINYDTAYWVGGQVGELVDFDGDYILNFKDIVTDLRENTPVYTMMNWYDYCLAVDDANMVAGRTVFTHVNYRSWLRGCPRRDISEIRQYTKMMRDMKEEFEKYVDGIIAENKEKGQE